MSKRTKTKPKKKGFIKSFAQFINRGNLLDMAIGVIMGAAFGAVLNSLVQNIIMPLLFGKNSDDLKALSWTIKDASGQVTRVLMEYGLFLNALIQFVIIALTIFTFLYFIVRRKEFEVVEPTDVTEPVVPEDIKLLTEIRDLLKKEDNEKK